MPCESTRPAFELHLRCFNCRKDRTRRLVAPDEPDSPDTIDELLESTFLQRQKFHCVECDSPIGTIVSVKMSRPSAVL